jgi:MFS family permease
MAQALAFGVLNQTGAITIPWVYGLSLAGGIVSAFMFPAWQAMVPDLVPRTSLLNAIALSSAQFNAARLVGPMVAAGVLALFGNSSGDGITAVFYVNAISFLFVIWALTVIRPAHDLNARRKEPAVKALLAGLRYARTHRRIALHLLTAAILTVFGMPFVALLPAIAADVYSLGSTGYSGLMGANGAGALVGALVVASLPHDVRRESIIRWGALVMALSLIGFSLMTLVAWAIVLLVVLGAAFLACVSSINTNLQTAVPPELRGRVMSLFVLSFMGIMPFGALAFGWLGDHIGPAQSVMVGAIALLGWALLLLARPALLCEAESDGC